MTCRMIGILLTLVSYSAWAQTGTSVRIHSDTLHYQFNKILQNRDTSGSSCSSTSNQGLIQKIISIETDCFTLKDTNACAELCKIAMPKTFDFEVDYEKEAHSNHLPDYMDICSPEGKLEIESMSLDQLKCEKGKKTFSSEEDLTRSFNEIKKDKSLRMKDPKNLCYERAVLLADQLAESGHESRLIEMTGSSESLAGTLNGKPFGFINHWAVQVKTKAGESFILDPQFFDSPMKSTDYLLALGGSSRPIHPQNFLERSSNDDQKSNAIVTKTFNSLTSYALVNQDVLTTKALNQIGCNEMRHQLVLSAKREIEN